MMFLVVALVVFILDRASKVAIQHNLALGEHVSVLGDFLWFNHSQNTGIAFSLATSHSSIVFFFDVIAILFILYLARRVPAGEPWMRLGLGLVLGGAIGNVVDRVLAGSVTDFIDFRVFPVFNVADSAITVGAILIAWRLYVGSKTTEAKDDEVAD
ncbi:MAG TPA: signal peptidase II [Candidatus Dormibacteraeota bacterium]|nr:signal peptidase II [Candidatus Dormibacteraeota bacterium]